MFLSVFHLTTCCLPLGLGLGGSNNTIMANTIFIIEPISDRGVSNNTFYLNNFQVHEGFGCIGANAFDYNGTGNYWSDYNGTDANGDGIGDTPYDTRPNINDSYPLMEP